MKIIAISGKRESGKSTLAKFLVSEHGYERISLARWLKDFCKFNFSLTEEQVDGHFKESPTQYRRTDGGFLTPRDIMIRTGIYFRSIDPLFFCKTLMNHVRLREAESFVVDDIRFTNEIEYFKTFGTKFVRIERSQEAIGKAALDDLSETQLDNFKDWDGLLIKELNRTPDDLKKFADYISIKL